MAHPKYDKTGTSFQPYYRISQRTLKCPHLLTPCQIPIVSSDVACEPGVGKRSVEFNSQAGYEESMDFANKQPELNDILEIHYAKVAVHD